MTFFVKRPSKVTLRRPFIPPPAGLVGTLTADAGAFTYTGNAALFRGAQVSAAGAYTYTGSASLFQLREVSAAGSYSYAGGATLYQLREISAAGSYTYTGAAALYRLSAVSGAGSYSYAGNAALFQERMLGGAGAYSYTGGDLGQAVYDAGTLGSASRSALWRVASKRKERISILLGFDGVGFGQPGAGFDAGVYSYTGQPSAFQERMVSAAGSYAYSGFASAYQIRVIAAAGSYPLTGRAALQQIRMVAAAGSYTYTGSDANFTTGSPTLTAGPGSYTSSGSDAKFRLTAGAGAGSYGYTGQPGRGLLILSAGVGSYPYLGADAALSGTNLIITQPTPAHGGRGVRHRGWDEAAWRRRQQIEESLSTSAREVYEAIIEGKVAAAPEQLEEARAIVETVTPPRTGKVGRPRGPDWAALSAELRATLRDIAVSIRHAAEESRILAQQEDDDAAAIMLMGML